MFDNIYVGNDKAEAERLREAWQSKLERMVRRGQTAQAVIKIKIRVL
jgi:hypothetical protein